MTERIDRAFELLVVWVLLASALGLAATLAGHFLAPQVLIASVLLAGAYGWHTRGSRASLGGTPDWRHLALLALVCLFFRLPGYDYVLGGQDEGLYVNIAHYIEHTGGIAVSDGPLERLQGSGYVSTYLAQNREGGRGSIYLPGVYLRSATGAKLQFQFYDLFPVWMALFIGLFGGTFGVYALSLFALLSVLFFHRLALVVSGSRKVALMAGLLLALSPLHAFFSKFPVTEIPTLAFSLMGFTFLAAYWRRAHEGHGGRWLAISAACFGALFFTRISGFMYMPFVIALAVASVILDGNRTRQRAIGYWALAVIGLYALSVGYGWHWSRQYSHDIYATSFRDLFGKVWKVGVGMSVIAVFALWAGIVRASRTERMRQALARRLVNPARVTVSVIVALGLLYGLLKIYRLGWTTHYANNPWLAGVWQLPGLRWHDVWASSLFALVVYTGLFVPLCFLVFVLRRQRDPQLEYLRVFVAGFFVYVAVLQWVIPYGPYYTRYLLSELVPYMVLFVVLVWASLRTRWQALVGAMLAVSALYAGVLSTCQLGKRENAGLYAQLHALVKPVDADDLVLLDSLGADSSLTAAIKTPLIYAFHKNVVTMNGTSLRNRAYLSALDARYDEVFLISPHMSAPKGFESTGGTRVRVWAFQWSHSYPHKLVQHVDMQLYLYRLALPVVPLGHAAAFTSAGNWNNWLLDGWSAPETWGTWSLGTRAALAIDPRQLPSVEGNLRLHFDANAFVTPAHPRQRIDVLLDGARVGSYVVDYPQAGLTFDVVVPADDLESTRKIRIDFDLPDATSPKALGISGDPRIIALGLKSVTAELAPAPAVTDAHGSKAPAAALH